MKPNQVFEDLPIFTMLQDLLLTTTPLQTCYECNGQQLTLDEDEHLSDDPQCRNRTLAKCGGEAQHLEKLGIWSPLGTPECSELDSKGKNTSHWGVLGVIGKVLKRRYRKWPRIGHLDICSPSYGQKKGQESNWQFDSRPLKVGN
jgi:hypothetical protein